MACAGVAVHRGTHACYVYAAGARFSRANCAHDWYYDLHVTSAHQAPLLATNHSAATGGATVAPFPTRGPLDAAKCDAMVRNRKDVFWIMFGLHAGMTKRDVNNVFFPEPCFGTGWKASETWAQSLLTDRCNRNYLGGALGTKGKPNARPLKGEAILGPDLDIYPFCTELAGHPVPPSSFELGEHEKLIAACLEAKRNFLRINKWNLCVNVEWQACLVRGKLPGLTDGNAAQFARAPYTLTMEEFRKPTPACASEAECKRKQLIGAFPTGHVFFWEVCFFAHVCRNRKRIFEVEVGESFHCDFDPQALVELGTILG